MASPVRYLLTCGKTGRWFHFASEGQARHAARSLGFTNYTIEALQ